LKTENNKHLLPFRLLLMVLLCVFTAGLAYAVLSLPPQASGLSTAVAVNLEISGVSNPVTAVLLNFRAYDTLLELGVLLLALLAVWSLGGTTQSRLQQQQSPPGEVLDMLSRLLVPIFILVAGYLLWVGAHAPGGAFQAGSVLAAVGVLLLLSGWCPEPKLAGLPLRFTLVAGMLVFVIVGLASMLLVGNFLQYPPEFSAVLILLIEAAATLSIGVTLAALFLGGEPNAATDASIDHS